MKSFFISVILFIIIIVAVILNAVYVSYVSRRLSDFCDALSDKKSSAALIKELQSFWEKHRPWLSFSLDNAQTERIEKIIRSLELSTKHGEEYDFEKNRMLLEEASREIGRLERLRAENIF